MNTISFAERQNAAAFLREFRKSLFADEFLPVRKYPRRVALYARRKAPRRFGGTFNVRDDPKRWAKRTFLILTVRTPVGAVHDSALVRETLGETIQCSRFRRAGIFPPKNKNGNCKNQNDETGNGWNINL